MSLAAPFFLWVASAVALATVAAHLLAWRRPPASPLPTARFAPERPARVVSRALRPTDLLLLAVRVAMVMLVGLALARPSFARERRGTARVVVVDQSRSVRDGAAVRDSARAALQPGDALVVFDSSAREVHLPTTDSLTLAPTAGERSVARGSISAALVAATRAGARLSREHDSVEVVIVSPVTADELDAATSTIRHQWAGPVRVVRAIPAGVDAAPPSRPVVHAIPGDPVAATLALVGPITSGAAVRVRRAALAPDDSAWAQDGGSLIVWPASLDAAAWPVRATPDTAYAVVAADAGDASRGPASASAAVVAPFARPIGPPAGRVVAWWSDGEPAATEVALGRGCIRAVAVAVPSTGDLALTPAFRHFARRMAEPCGGDAPLAPAADSVVARLLPVAPESGAASRPVRAAGAAEPSRLATWLLGIALALAIGELVLRKGEAHAVA